MLESLFANQTMKDAYNTRCDYDRINIDNDLFLFPGSRFLVAEYAPNNYTRVLWYSGTALQRPSDSESMSRPFGTSCSPDPIAWNENATRNIQHERGLHATLRKMWVGACRALMQGRGITDSTHRCTCRSLHCGSRKMRQWCSVHS